MWGKRLGVIYTYNFCHSLLGTPGEGQPHGPSLGLRWPVIRMARLLSFCHSSFNSAITSVQSFSCPAPILRLGVAEMLQPLHWQTSIFTLWAFSVSVSLPLSLPPPSLFQRDFHTLLYNYLNNVILTEFTSRSRINFIPFNLKGVILVERRVTSLRLHNQIKWFWHLAAKWREINTIIE